MDSFATEIHSDEFADDYEDRLATQEEINRALQAIADYREERAWMDSQLRFDETV